MQSKQKTHSAFVHRWDLTPKAAIALQRELAALISRKSLKRPDQMRTVAGIDAAYRRGAVHATVVVMDLTALQTIETVQRSVPITFPYIPGLLSFREGPAISKALEDLETSPDLLMVDGQGIAHQRRLGIASHVGLLANLPSIGCAKTRLVGEYDEPGNSRGSVACLTDGQETIGAVVRTRTGVKPVFVSVGHMMSLEDSVRVVLDTGRGYRLPEPVRRADFLSRKNL